MSAPCTCVADLLELRRRVADLESHVKKATPVINEHEDRLDDHDRQLTAILDDVRETKRTVNTLRADVSRLADASTSQGLTLEKVHRNVQRLLEVFEPTVVVSPEVSRG